MEAYSTPAPLDRLATLRRAVGHSLEGDGEHPKEVLLSPRCGALPPGLRGTLYRNGPGRFSVNGDRYRHLFDGDGLVSRFEFSDAGVRFRSRFVRTEAFLAETAAGRRLFRSYGTNAPGGALRSAFRLKFKNTANTSVTMHGGRLLALWEGGAPYALDPTTLETEGRHDFDGALGPTTVLSRSMGLEGPFSAHPKLDARTGDLLSFGMEPGPRAKLHLYRVSPAGALTVERTIALPMATFVHDFALTENYAVFLLSSLRLDMARMAMGVSSLLDSIRDSAEGVVPLLVPRDPRKPVCFSRPLGSGFVYHLVSARESQDQVVVDALWLRDFAPRHFSLAADSPLRAGAIPNADLRRIVICKDGGRALSRIIRSEACDSRRFRVRTKATPT
ncbi:MAG: carotenoid oxygenase family protein [Myxococcota bacterium]